MLLPTVRALAVYVVGGYVRDILLGREVKDTDIVVIGSGVGFAKIVAKDLERTNLILFENFGTAMLPLDDRKLEFVGARKESYRKDSRNRMSKWEHSKKIYRGEILQ